MAVAGVRVARREGADGDGRGGVGVLVDGVVGQRDVRRRLVEVIVIRRRRLLVDVGDVRRLRLGRRRGLRLWGGLGRGQVYDSAPRRERFHLGCRDSSAGLAGIDPLAANGDEIERAVGTEGATDVKGDAPPLGKPDRNLVTVDDELKRVAVNAGDLDPVSEADLDRQARLDRDFLHRAVGADDFHHRTPGHRQGLYHLLDRLEDVDDLAEGAAGKGDGRRLVFAEIEGEILEGEFVAAVETDGQIIALANELDRAAVDANELDAVARRDTNRLAGLYREPADLVVAIGYMDKKGHHPNERSWEQINALPSPSLVALVPDGVSASQKPHSTSPRAFSYRLRSRELAVDLDHGDVGFDVAAPVLEAVGIALEVGLDDEPGEGGGVERILQAVQGVGHARGEIAVAGMISPGRHTLIVVGVDLESGGLCGLHDVSPSQ